MPTTRFSRHPSASVFGKCDPPARLEIPMPRAMRDRLERLARLEGKPVATLAREQLEIVILFEEERVRRIVEEGAADGNARKEG